MHTRATRSEPVAAAGAAPGQAQVGVDHLDAGGGPAQPGRPCRQIVWRSVDSVCSRTCTSVDWRTCTIAARSRWEPVTSAPRGSRRSPPAPAWPRARIRPCWPVRRPSPPALPQPPDGRQQRGGRQPWPSPAPAGQQLQVDRRDLLQHHHEPREVSTSAGPSGRSTLKWIWIWPVFRDDHRPRQLTRSTRLRSRGKAARPYICRLIILVRLTLPSTTPELHGMVSPLSTAS